jgi:hypothetical protein
MEKGHFKNVQNGKVRGSVFRVFCSIGSFGCGILFGGIFE